MRVRLEYASRLFSVMIDPTDLRTNFHAPYTTRWVQDNLTPGLVLSATRENSKVNLVSVARHLFLLVEFCASPLVFVLELVDLFVHVSSSRSRYCFQLERMTFPGGVSLVARVQELEYFLDDERDEFIVLWVHGFVVETFTPMVVHTCVFARPVKGGYENDNNGK